MQPFVSNPNNTVNINVGAASQAVQLYPEAGTINVRIMNNGTATVWISFGDPNVTATLATGIPIGPGVTEVLTFQDNGNAPLYVAAIAAGATGKIYFTPGRGF